VTPRVEELLHQGEYEQAYEILIAAAEKRRLSKSKAAAALIDLAEFYSLYGEAETQAWRNALLQAESRWRAAASLPLFRALGYELAALRGEVADRPQMEDARGRFHLAQAQYYRADFPLVLELLTDVEGLPLFLQVRAHALRARALENLGRLPEAAASHARAAAVATAKEKLWSLLDAAALWLEAAAAIQARRALDEAEGLLRLGEMSERATFHYLLARCELQEGNPGLAGEQIARAEGFEAAGGGLTHTTAMLRAQVHSQLGQLRHARAAYREAERRAGSSDLPFIWHEWGLAELDAGGLLEAQAQLSKAASSPEYPHHAHALADLAEAYYRIGNGRKAEELALESLQSGQPATAHLLLGNRAYDAGELQEALAHYRAAAAIASEGDRDWVTANEMIVDTLAQLGFPDPEEAIELADRVLPYLARADEWFTTVRDHAERARQLARKNRLLN